MISKPLLRQLLLGSLALVPGFAAEPGADVAWPPQTREARPWTRWWWLGSAVDKENLTRQLTLYRDAGIGGVEICPLYGAKGYESRYLPFLSPGWMEMFGHTTAEGKRLDLGIDLTTGTGWPFGGPWVKTEDSSAKVILKQVDATAADSLKEAGKKATLQCLTAVSDSGETLDLTAKWKDGKLDWTAPAGTWKLYSVWQQSGIQQVKRPAPGGEGNVVDPYSLDSLNRYLAKFDEAFAGYQGAMPGYQFHDSFEYFGATWTKDFFREFEKRRGYDLKTKLPAFFGEGDPDTVARVKGDYRTTISELHLAYIQRWTDWAHGHGSLTREQAHGAPANLIDLYAIADIPETEIFGTADDKLEPMFQFASSAAHLTGRKYASSESFTWLGEHFQTTLAEAKPAADMLLLSGINHLFFHGIPYSPAEAPWPGWQFYAAVNFGPQGGLWRDLPNFNGYLTRCQSVLQSGAPDNDVLLYFPVDDLYHDAKEQLIPFTMHNAETVMAKHSFYKTAHTLTARGYNYDHVSDQFLAKATGGEGTVKIGDAKYRAIIVPNCHVIPLATIEKLAALSQEGTPVLFLDKLPDDVPGLSDLDKRRAAFRAVIEKNQAQLTLGSDVAAMLDKAGVHREMAVDQGLRYIRRTHDQGWHYFLVNRGTQAISGWVPLSVPANSAVILDPRQADRSGVARLQTTKLGTEVFLQLEPGESCIVRTFTTETAKGRAWDYDEPAGEPKLVDGTWSVRFIDGGPALPAPYQGKDLVSWTSLDDVEAKRFAGTALYSTEVTIPEGVTSEWVLDLGRVCESARVRVNGKDAGVAWSAPFKIHLGHLLHAGSNTLEIEVTNVAANRIADLDRQKVDWKYFHEINFVGKDYKPFDASKWPARDSGLFGPVRLLPVK
ncbi:glycosyl hydrolase [Luteolibacter sp. LG18]|uniref:glycosyl hydrolase n=1 Tax=Luteolibacter sp. LG18 TaxID=2819286 RepID=UPI002B3255B2|nr:glycosyl hydrolase family 2 [Luteolibacter sp. LG18]